MATLDTLGNSAVIVIDMQQDVLAAAFKREEVLGHIVDLVARARAASVPVVWVQHHDEDLPRGSAGWQLMPGLVPLEDETRVEKQYGDAFEGTALETALADLGVSRLFVVGAQTDACVRSTLHGAFARGYDVVLVGDAHTTEDKPGTDMPTARQMIALTNRYWSRHAALGRTAEVMTTEQIDFGRMPPPEPLIH